MKLVVETLMSSLKPIGNLLVIAGVFFTIFGILGVQVFVVFFLFLFLPISLDLSQQKCRSAEVQKCRNAEVQKCRNAEVQKCRNAEVQNVEM